MIRAIKSAYGAGWRAGFTLPPLVKGENGHYYVVQPANPFTKPAQFLLRHAWEEGQHQGRMERWRRSAKKTVIIAGDSARGYGSMGDELREYPEPTERLTA